MDQLFKNHYVAVLFAAGFILLMGTLTVLNRSVISPSTAGNGWNVNGVIADTNPAVPIPTTPAPVRPTQSDTPYTYISPLGSKEKKPATAAATESDNGFSWDSFISSLSHGHTPSHTDTDNSSISDAYAFIPTSFISTTEPIKLETPSQKALYSWGSDAGNEIQNYENSHPDQVAILTNFMQDREDAGKVAAMKKLGADLIAAGDGIANIDPIPSQMKQAGPALAESYREIGRNLAAIPDARGDDNVVKAILAYDSSAEHFVQSYVAVALIFQANAITFTQGEPGSVFMFPGSTNPF